MRLIRAVGLLGKCLVGGEWILLNWNPDRWHPVGCSYRIQIGRGDATIEERNQPHEIIDYSASRFFELFERSATLYNSGTSLHKIAEQLQVGKTTVRESLVAGGVRLRPDNKSPEGKSALRQRKVPYANPPYGYAFLDGRFMVHPKEIQNVRRMLEMRKQGLSFNAIAKSLNVKCIAPRSGKKWDHSVIADIIRRDSDKQLRRLRQGV